MKLRTMPPAAAVTIGSLLLAAAVAGATTASETLTAGSLGFASTPGNVTFPGTTLDGQNKTVTDTNVTSTPGGTTTVVYPYSLPAATTAPTATKLVNAPAGTGMGDQTVTPTWALAIPATAYAGNYTSTWTLSLVSAP
jgi:hypothetical protein